MSNTCKFYQFFHFSDPSNQEWGQTHPEKPIVPGLSLDSDSVKLSHKLIRSYAVCQIWYDLDRNSCRIYKILEEQQSDFKILTFDEAVRIFLEMAQTVTLTSMIKMFDKLMK